MCICVYLCGILCEYVSIWVILCHIVRFVCIPVCIVCICTYFRVPNCGVCISTPEMMYRTASRMSYLLRCQFWGVQSWGCVYMCVFGGVSIWGVSVSICVNCVYSCVNPWDLCVFVRILVWNPVNSCRNVWNTVFCVSFCEFYGMT